METSIDLVSKNSNRYSIVPPRLPYTDYLIVNELEVGCSIAELYNAAEKAESRAKK